VIEVSKMRTLSEFLKTTIVGGVVFLLPVGIILIVVQQLLRLASQLSEPIAKLFPNVSLLGIGMRSIIAIAMLVVIAFIAGLISRTSIGRRIKDWVENSLLGGLPQYQMVKSMAAGFAQIESADGLKPALLNVEDGWQIGYLLEELDNGWSCVFVPDSPTPMSGATLLLPAERVRPLDITMAEAMQLVKRMGIGSAEALKGVDLQLPGGQAG
jgi:uncharacterized membrane protein